ncbi:MAG TPA: hypothetical protein DEA96_14815 [Leptospiraceae bacterium]|nr:hypothetical protein [Spirochaetaceae bacterium]HBS06238.1 hypothetical protein [Leptospiraceae bacterium]
MLLYAHSVRSGLEVKRERGAGESSYTFEFQCELELRDDDATTLILWVARDGHTPESMYRAVLARIEEAGTGYSVSVGSGCGLQRHFFAQSVSVLRQVRGWTIAQ